MKIGFSKSKQKIYREKQINNYYITRLIFTEHRQRGH